MAKITLDNIASGYASTTKINNNNDAIEAELNNKVLYRNNPSGEPNQMENELDMNSNKIINLPDGISNQEPVTVQQLNGAIAAAGSGLIASQTEVQLGSQAVSRVFTFTGITYTIAGNNLFVFRNGQKLEKGVDYNETSSSSITLLFDPNDNDRFNFITNLATTNSTSNTSAITHTQSGTDYNLATYLQNRYVEWPEVAADNSTDDTAVIQAAIDKVNASYLGGTFGGAAGKVMLPAGLIRTSGLILKKGVSLEGQGQGNTVLLLDADGGTCLKTPAKDSQIAADQIEQSEIRGITFGIHTSLTPTTSTILLDTSGMSRCYFEDVSFLVPSNVIGVDNTGNTLAGSGGPAHWHNTWVHCFVDVSGGIGVRWGDNDSSIGEQVLAQTWIGGQIKGTSGTGIHMRGSTGNFFLGTQFQGLNTGSNNCIIIGDTTGTRVSTSNNFHGCYFENCRIVQYSNTNRNQRWGGFETGVVETDNGLKNGRVDDEQLYLGWTRTYASARVTTPTTINKGYNMASITKVGTGIYDCVFTDALPDTNYIAIAQAESSDAIPRISTKNTGQVRVVFENRAGTAVDPTSFVIKVEDV